jgi:hypothetical protein
MAEHAAVEYGLDHLQAWTCLHINIETRCHENSKKTKSRTRPGEYDTHRDARTD